MYLAELHGKLSARVERSEDILTSNVFSFFKYSTREIFLKRYLKNELKLNVSTQDANEAEFIFWPRFEENTQPDLVIIVGNYYLLIEAKYFSGFAEGSKDIKAQLLREIEQGDLEARNYDKKFKLIAITGDHYYKTDKFRLIPQEFRKSDFIWRNWQSIAKFLDNTLEGSKDIRKEEMAFASDLYALLDRKHFRDFQGIHSFYNTGALTWDRAFIFFEAITARFRGGFIGFTESLSAAGRILPVKKEIFLRAQEKRYGSLLKVSKLRPFTAPVFYKEG